MLRIRSERKMSHDICRRPSNSTCVINTQEITALSLREIAGLIDTLTTLLKQRKHEQMRLMRAIAHNSPDLTIEQRLRAFKQISESIVALGGTERIARTITALRREITHRRH